MIPGPGVVRIPCVPRPAVALSVPASRPATLVAVSRTEDQPDLFILRHIVAVAAMEVERLKAEREGGWGPRCSSISSTTVETGMLP